MFFILSYQRDLELVRRNPEGVELLSLHTQSKRLSDGIHWKSDYFWNYDDGFDLFSKYLASHWNLYDLRRLNSAPEIVALTVWDRARKVEHEPMAEKDG
jgi:hypothetical protein